MASERIITDRLKLSILTMDHVQAVFKSLNYKNTAEIISFLSWPMTMDQAESFCKTSETGYSNKTDFIYLACNKHDNTVGCIGLHIDAEQKFTAETGYWIDEDQQGKGYASEMLKAVLNFAKQKTTLQTVYATTAMDNPASGHILIKSGFKKDTVIDKALPDGQTRQSHKYILSLR